MVVIEVIGLDPPCDKCTELLNNAEQAVKLAGIEARVEKKWTLDPEIRKRYGLLLSPALALEGIVIAQGKVYKAERIAGLLQG
ncbi:MAG: thioredoxin family protein [Desulfobacterales bacterium]